MAQKTIFMTREQHQKWDAALRSGSYEQGHGRLRTSSGRFCCLGVLEHCLTGEVEDRGVPSQEWLDIHGIRFLGALRNEVEGPAPFLPKLGRSAWSANDFGGNSFEEIADAIAEAVEYTD